MVPRRVYKILLNKKFNSCSTSPEMCPFTPPPPPLMMMMVLLPLVVVVWMAELLSCSISSRESLPPKNFPFKLCSHRAVPVPFSHHQRQTITIYRAGLHEFEEARGALVEEAFVCDHHHQWQASSENNKSVIITHRRPCRNRT